VKKQITKFQKNNSQITPELQKWTHGFLHKNMEAFDALAHILPDTKLTKETIEFREWVEKSIEEDEESLKMLAKL
jgi:hypothetical protein